MPNFSPMATPTNIPPSPATIRSMPWQAARLALGQGQRAALRFLAHLRQDGEEVTLFDQLRHALRDILHTALDGPELDPVRVTSDSKSRWVTSRTTWPAACKPLPNAT